MSVDLANPSTPLPAVADPITLDNCASEPIRIPGSIQPHGFLLGLDETHEHVVLASENARDFLQTPLKLILGAPVSVLFERELTSMIQRQSCSSDPDGMISYVGAFRIHDDLFSVVTHCVEGKRILEFERQDRLVGSEMMNTVITNFVATLSRLETEQELCDAITKQVAAMTGFDRVMLYSFDEEGNGTVRSEANSGLLPTYMNLRFPASDIPQQARDLYVLNTVRIIPNGNYVPSPLRSSDGAPHIVDLSLSVLRSVSPIHLEYMRNMGTASSMSISILSEGRLWGLISGHHSQPRMVPFLVRSACDMLSKLVGTQLTTFRTAARLQTLTKFHAVQRELLTHIAAQFDYIGGIGSQMDLVRQVTGADGAALWVDGDFQHVGITPDRESVARIVEWLDNQPELDLFETRYLESVLPWAREIAPVAAGLLAIRVSDIRQKYLLWFRPELVQTVQWAGEPIKLKGPDDRLNPRKSFESWRETFRGQARRWTSAEMSSAREFRAAITTISLRRAEEEAELSNARFEQLTHALPEKIFTADDAGNILYVNDRWREAGLSEGGRWYSQGRLSPEDEERIAAVWREHVESGEFFEEEIRLLTGSDNVPRWNLVRAVPFMRRGAARAGWIGSMFDLTERRERETALRMTEKLALTGRMTSVIAHEINNPLESITNLLYLIRHDLVEGSDAMQYVSQAESELVRISGITKQTLRWSRENSGGSESFTAGAVFADVLRLFHGKIRNRHVTAELRGGDDIEIQGIQGQIRQVIANLVANAIDAARVGGTVWIDAGYASDTLVEVRVGDDGIGMSPETVRHLFQPFFSTKGDLGNGLGLYISHEIIERHGGELRVESELDKGTVMRILLPRKTQVRTGTMREGEDLLA
ncbi:bacteriophytochrome (light-regulated signal transduction histidine kinase) [Terriglobus roseus DSM 18391]|uniref:histidine kinase n=1 Tax=Terriglobus roseus (strain DSM 18391 / NRRL B-41598 / KBS 63) TaxID=926566 RepID=I3ZCH5_TERRK|nr:ATP-binding protein [Terriglobus roseus]AFL86943.1 bacteriophytochrome (light-regulated signal transduction histidine kinase) [Terriglobus roseus DSM 18391]